MADFKDHFSTKSDSYASYRLTYPQALAEQLAKLCNEKSIALDCGCGTGQLSLLLADYFDEVIATDASDNQVKNASPHRKINYKVAPAEQIPLPDHSIDITVAQAAHWLDLEKFYAEVKRVLKPQGVIALITYQNSILDDQAINELIQKFYGETLDQYWPPERRLVESGYKTLPFPFNEVEFRAPPMTAEWDFHQLYGYFTTWSAFKAFEAAGGKHGIAKFKNDLENAWHDLDIKHKLTWPLALRVGRVD